MNTREYRPTDHTGNTGNTKPAPVQMTDEELDGAVKALTAVLKKPRGELWTPQEILVSPELYFHSIFGDDVGRTD